MRRFMIYVSDETAAGLDEVAKRCAAEAVASGRDDLLANVTVEKLLQMLADDLGLVAGHPHTLESAAMQQVLRVHGFHIAAAT